MEHRGKKSPVKITKTGIGVVDKNIMVHISQTNKRITIILYRYNSNVEGKRRWGRPKVSYRDTVREYRVHEGGENGEFIGGCGFGQGPGDMNNECPPVVTGINWFMALGNISIL